MAGFQPSPLRSYARITPWSAFQSGVITSTIWRDDCQARVSLAAMALASGAAATTANAAARKRRLTKRRTEEVMRHRAWEG